MFRNFVNFENHIAIADDSGITFTYSQLGQNGDELSSHVGGRTLVLHICQNNPASITGYTGFLRAGIVQILLNDSLNVEFIKTVIQNYGPTHAYVPQELGRALDGTVISEFRNYHLLRFNVAPVELNPDLALLLSTSGSTGNPKMVRLSARNLDANTQSILSYLPIESTDRVMTTMPMAYSYGLSILNTHLEAGATVVTTSASIMNKGFWDLMRQSEVTTFGGVPYFYEMLKKLKFEHIPLPSLRYVTQAGGRMPPTLSQEFAEICSRKDLKFYAMYGQTEATARMSYQLLPDSQSKYNSIGKAIPGGKFWLTSPNGDIISETNTEGQLVYQGANVCMGYAESTADLKLPDINQGVLATGDVAYFDRDGDFFITGRKNDFVKLFGLRINVADIENMLKSSCLDSSFGSSLDSSLDSSFGSSFDCACVGNDEAIWVFFTEKHRAKDLEHHLISKTKIPKSGFRFVPIDSIPRSSTGKILYGELTPRMKL